MGAKRAKQGAAWGNTWISDRPEYMCSLGALLGAR